MQVHDPFNIEPHVLLLTLRHVGVADVFIVTRVGIAIRSELFRKGASQSNAVSQSITWGMAVNNTHFPTTALQHILVDPCPSQFGSSSPTPSTRSTQDRSASLSLLRLVPSQRLLGLAGPVGCSCPECLVRLYVAWLQSAESCPQPCSCQRMTPAAGWRGASMSIHMYQHWLSPSLALRSSGAMAQLSARVSLKKPSNSRPVVRPGWPVNGSGLDQWYSSIEMSQHGAPQGFSLPFDGSRCN